MWRRQEKRAAAAIRAYAASAGEAVDARTLVSMVGTAIGAAGCALTVAGVQHTWGVSTEPWTHHQVAYDGEPQGIIALAPASLGPLPRVIAALGAPLAVIRLTQETDRLRRSGDAAARQLIDDRWQATVAMEQERRTLERNLHDGAQHHIVALRMALALVEDVGENVHERLPSLLTRLDMAERVLVDTAAGVLPLVLASDGLAAALAAELADDQNVTLDVTGLRRSHSPGVEAAVYFTCLEAVSNAHKYAPHADITVTVGDSARGLEFEVADNGPGFSDSIQASGLHNLSERVAAVGGAVTVRPTPTGTTVYGRLPR